MTTSQQPESGGPSFSDADVRVATDFLTQELEEPVQEIVTLTDEELAALDGIQHEPVTPVPWLAENAEQPEARAVAAGAAMRSLVARGMVSSTVALDPRRYEEGSQEPATMVAVPELHGIAVARRTADAVLVAERRTDRGNATGYFYVFRADAGPRVLWEAFDSTGFHLFFLLEGATLAEQLLAFSDPIGGADDSVGDAPPEEIPAAEFGESATASRLADSRAVTTLVAIERGAEEPVVKTLFSRPGALELMETTGQDDAAVHRVAPISADVLGQFVDDVLAGDTEAGDSAEQ